MIGIYLGCVWDVFGMYLAPRTARSFAEGVQVRMCSHSAVICGGRAAPHVYAKHAQSRRACSSACAQRATVDEPVLNEIYLLSPAPTPQMILLIAPCRRTLGAHTLGSGLAAKLMEKPL